MSGNSASHTPTSRGADPAGETGADTRMAPECPSAEGSEEMSVTNSEVERAMNHRLRRAVLRDLGFSKDAFDAFSSADAYIRATRDGLGRATKQHLTDVQVSFLCPNRITTCQ